MGYTGGNFACVLPNRIVLSKGLHFFAIRPRCISDLPEQEMFCFETSDHCVACLYGTEILVGLLPFIFLSCSIILMCPEVFCTWTFDSLDSRQQTGLETEANVCAWMWMSL